MKSLTWPALPCATLIATLGGCSVDADDTGNFGASATSRSASTDGDSSGGEDPEGSCLDAVQNGDESDVDCGGRCPACDDGNSCDVGDDCLSYNCIHGLCGLPTCDDGVQNQNETDVDCGGKCEACDLEQGCGDGSDCASGMCSDGVCASPSCDDGVTNQNETDVDCGGKSCSPCVDGGACVANFDCDSGYCAQGTCAPKTCVSHDDCDVLDSSCAVGTCDKDTFVCIAIPINEGQACDDQNLCTNDTECVAGQCGGGSLRDCTQLDGACTVGVCNENDGTCEAEIANEGKPCDDGDACTVAEACQLGTCIDPDGPAIHMWEPFADNDAGWSLGPTWQIGAATVSPPGGVGGPDPGVDHTDSGDNGVAGASIGGLVSGPMGWSYLQSPVIPLDAAPGDVQLSLWRWLNADVTSKMPSTIGIWDGAKWVTLWENAESVHDDVSWHSVSADVTPYKNASFRLRVGFRVQGGASTAAGWNVDDVLLAPPGCPAP